MSKSFTLSELLDFEPGANMAGVVGTCSRCIRVVYVSSESTLDTEDHRESGMARVIEKILTRRVYDFARGLRVCVCVCVCWFWWCCEWLRSAAELQALGRARAW